MQRLEVSGAVRPIYESLGVKRLIIPSQMGGEYEHASSFTVGWCVGIHYQPFCHASAVSMRMSLVTIITYVSSTQAMRGKCGEARWSGKCVSAGDQ